MAKNALHILVTWSFCNLQMASLLNEFLQAFSESQLYHDTAANDLGQTLWMNQNLILM